MPDKRRACFSNYHSIKLISWLVRPRSVTLYEGFHYRPCSITRWFWLQSSLSKQAISFYYRPSFAFIAQGCLASGPPYLSGLIKTLLGDFSCRQKMPAIMLHRHGSNCSASVSLCLLQSCLSAKVVLGGVWRVNFCRPNFF